MQLHYSGMPHEFICDYISDMLARFLIVLVCAALCSCGTFPLTGNKKTVKPRYHHSYYKKHIYHKHLRVGKVHIKLFEKQGVKTVKKN